MILVAVLVLFAVALAVLSVHSRKQPDARSLWRSVLRIGIGVGAARAALASLGWYIVEHDGGPLQIPAYALAMFALPEAAVLSSRRVTPVPGEFYVALSLLLVTSTLVLVGLVALATRRPGDFRET